MSKKLPTQAQLRETILASCRKQAGREMQGQVSPTSKLGQVGFDQYDFEEVLIAIEQDLEISIPDDDFKELCKDSNSPNSIADLILQKVTAAACPK